MKVLKAVCKVTVIFLILVNINLSAQTKASMKDYNKMIKNWPKVPKEVAMKMMDKYGTPSEGTEEAIVWVNNGPWLRTIIFKEEIEHNFPGHHTDVMQQFISYKVPLDKYDDLAMYDGSVIVERTRGEISARCDKEEANFLALNLANDIITGKKNVQEARESYASNIMMLMAGETPEYTQGLVFESMSGTRDSDMPFNKNLKSNVENPAMSRSHLWFNVPSSWTSSTSNGMTTYSSPDQNYTLVMSPYSGSSYSSSQSNLQSYLKDNNWMSDDVSYSPYTANGLTGYMTTAHNNINGIDMTGYAVYSYNPKYPNSGNYYYMYTPTSGWKSNQADMQTMMNSAKYNYNMQNK